MYLSYKQNPHWLIQKTRDKKSWEAVDHPEIDQQLVNKTFQSIDDVQQIIDPSASSDSYLNFYLTDKTERVITNLKMSDYYANPNAASTSKSTSAKKTSKKEPLTKEEKTVSSEKQQRKKKESSEKVEKGLSEKVEKGAKKVEKSLEKNKESEEKPSELTNPPKSGRKRKQDIISDDPPQLKTKKLPRITTPSTSPHIKPVEPTQEIEIDPIQHRERSVDVSALHQPLPTEQKLSSVFRSTETIQQKYKPDPKTISCVNNYDQSEESFLARHWMTPEQIERGNSKWNSVAACYSVLFYVQKILKWPLDEVRVVTTYDTNAVKLSLVIPQIYKIYGIERRLEESSSIVKLLVYCIASMNSFGIIRPMIFKGTTNQGHHIEKFCASKQFYERIPYYVSWPWRTTSKHAYTIVNRLKLNEIALDRTILMDLHSDRNTKKLLRDIPDWVYGLIKK